MLEMTGQVSEKRPSLKIGELKEGIEDIKESGGYDLRWIGAVRNQSIDGFFLASMELRTIIKH